ncbi:hypothetical protein ABH920_007889 [Catenulispora sp. EB89]|uniref:VWA domain-containing protein n=1 Tax=Catenulispora sp. EB89 TaxID=3156257 RepID=UPI0035116EE5
MLTSLVAVGAGAGPASAAGRPRSDPGPTGSAAGLAPANIVIAVDESGSITPDKMAQEKAAATSILYDEFNQQSSVEVIGFGGRDEYESATNPQAPTICPMTPLSTPVQRGSVATCVSGLARRSDQEGNNTDFNAVLDQAVTDLRNAPASYQRLVFLLTDGVMQVYNPNAGSDDATRLARAILTNQTIPDALAAHVSIWGLGFGTDAKLDDLTPMAQHSYQDQCAANRAQLVPDVSETRTTLLAQFFASARCAVFKNGNLVPLSSGSTVDVPVDIPVIATSGAIEVLTGDPQDKVVFEDPHQNPVPTTDTVGATHYELEGSGGVIQTLQITNPPPGTWHVVISAPAGSPVQSVAADVLWQGRLTSDIVVDGDAVPGQPVAVDVELIASRDGALTADALKDVKVVAGMSGTGFDPVSTPLQADSGRPGLYHGSITVPPSATGGLTLTGLVTGPGVAAQQNVSYPQLRVPGAGSVNANFIIGSTTVHPGDDFTVMLQLENQSGRAHTVTVELQDAQPGVTLRQPTVSLSSDSGVRPPVPLTIHVDRAVRPGRISGALTATDTDTKQQYTSRFLPVDIVPPPSFVQKYGLWLALGLGLLVAVVFAVAWAIRSRLRGGDVRDITMTLFDRYGDIYEQLPAPSVPATRFPFGLVGVGDEGQGRLVRVGGVQWVARRRRNGLMVSSEGRDPAVLYVGDRIALSEDINLGYEDRRVRQDRTGLLDRLLGGRDPGTAADPGEDPQTPEVV